MPKHVLFSLSAAAVLFCSASAELSARPLPKIQIKESVVRETAPSTGTPAGLADGQYEGGGGLTSGQGVNIGLKGAALGSSGGTRGRAGGGGVSGGVGGGGGGGTGGGGGGTGGGGGGSSSPSAIPAQCFGRQVISGDWDSPSYVASDKNEGFGVNFRNRTGKMHVFQFKTDKAGYWFQSRIVYDEDFNISAFVSPTPCDYGWAYQHKTVKQGYGAFDLPVMTEKQADEVFKTTHGPFTQWYGYSREMNLQPNSYYYLNVINVASPVHSGYRTNAQLAAAPEACQGNRGEGNCYYLIIQISNKFHTGGPAPIPQ